MLKVLDKVEAALDWPADMIVRHFERRQFELAMAIIMSGVGMLLFLSPASLEASSMKYLLQVMRVETCATVFFLAGIARIVALALNGHWMPNGAYVRAGGAAVGAIMWSQWGAALLQLHFTGHPISPGVIVYSGLAFFEVISFSRALRGAASSERTHRQGLGHDQQMALDPANKLDGVFHRDHITVAAHQKTVAVTKD